MCIPYAGGSLQAFRRWPTALGQLHVHIVQLPGRGRGVGQHLPDSMAEVADRLARQIRELPDGDVAIFGHSLGALIGFETAQRLEAAGRPVRRLFASASRAPDTAGPRYHQLPDGEFLELLKGFGATPPQFLRDPELVRLYLPILRADFRLTETYQPETDAAVDCAIDALWGTSDGPRPDLAAAGWAQRTRGAFATTSFIGDHFFLHQAEPAVLQHVAAALNMTPLRRAAVGRHG
ncbi:thioesterase II family protein [Micromonospora chokoriensis]|uniref:thioesterase II family protein n=1 Tax=Micromonospora chokoriensis TaxID=356851 RepID=UPI000691050F|nr:alpha/beta fold hydrolase [Micromonospora chokoriensis]